MEEQAFEARRIFLCIILLEGPQLETWMMWDSPLHAVNMLYYHWLVLQSMTGQNIARLEEIERESRQSQGDTMLELYQ